MRQGFVVALVLAVFPGCAHRAAAPAAAAGSEPGPVPGAVAKPVPDPTVRLRFAALDEVELGAGAAGRRALDMADPRGSSTLADLAATLGVFVPLATVVDGDQARPFAIEPTPICPQAWIVDVAAPRLATTVAATGVPAVLRAGCGPVQHADFVTAFGRERAIVYGEAPFDARMVASELAIVRSEIERAFGVRIAEPWLNELVVEPAGTSPTPRATASPTGLRVQLDGATPWADEQRLEVGSSIARIWLGRLVGRIAPPGDSGADTPERAALLHGVARGIARESLFELGLLSPDGYAADLDRAEATVADRLQPWRAPGVVDGRDVAARAAAASIEAAMLAWSLRGSRAPMGLPDVLEESASRTEDPAVLWRRLVGEVKLRRLGPCIVPRTVRQRVVDLGYAAPWDPTRNVAIVAATREGGDGLRVGDELRRVALHGDVATVQAVREGRQLDLRVAGQGQVIARRGWTRRSDVADERCYPQI